MPYRISNHTADVALEVSADSLPEFFQLLVMGIAIMYTGPGYWGKFERDKLTLNGPNLESLAVQLGNEIIYRFDAHAELLRELSDPQVVQQDDGSWTLEARMVTTPVRGSLAQEGDLKAATYHGLAIVRSPSGSYSGTMIIDT